MAGGGGVMDQDSFSSTLITGKPQILSEPPFVEAAQKARLRQSDSTAPSRAGGNTPVRPR
jgi:hypothetical protein